MNGASGGTARLTHEQSVFAGHTHPPLLGPVVTGLTAPRFAKSNGASLAPSDWLMPRLSTSLIALGLLVRVVNWAAPVGAEEGSNSGISRSLGPPLLPTVIPVVIVTSDGFDPL